MDENESLGQRSPGSFSTELAAPRKSRSLLVVISGESSARLEGTDDRTEQELLKSEVSKRYSEEKLIGETLRRLCRWS